MRAEACGDVKQGITLCNELGKTTACNSKTVAFERKLIEMGAACNQTAFTI